MFISRLVSIIIHEQYRITRFTNRKVEGRTEKVCSCRECRKQVCGTGRTCKERCTSRSSGTSSKKSYKLLERKEVSVRQEGQEGKEAKGRINFLSFISLTILYLDLADTYPSYALTNLFVVWKTYIQSFNNSGVYN